MLHSFPCVQLCFLCDHCCIAKLHQGKRFCTVLQIGIVVEISLVGAKPIALGASSVFAVAVQYLVQNLVLAPSRAL
jgi:hypothetical protein